MKQKTTLSCILIGDLTSSLKISHPLSVGFCWFQMHTAITIKVARSKLNDKTKGFKGRREKMHMLNSNEILFGQVCTSLVYDKE